MTTGAVAGVVAITAGLATAAEAGPRAAADADAQTDTTLAMISLRPPGTDQPPTWDSRFQVLVEPAAGRIQLNDDAVFEDVYLHVTIGRLTGDGTCAPDLTVVLDGDDFPVAGVYDAELAAVPVLEQFAEVAPPGDVARFRIPPFPGVDCANAQAHAAADPAAPGEALLVSRGARPLSAAGVVPVTDEARVTIEDWPDPTPYDAQVAATAGYRMTGSWAPDSFRSPSTAGRLHLEVTPGPDATLVGTAMLDGTDVDLWAQPTGTLPFTVDLDPAALYDVTQPTASLTIDGASTGSTPRQVPVSVPVPTEWRGTLAGQTWWRPTSYTVKNSLHVGFAIVRFLDEEWAYLEGWKYGFDGEAPSSCTEVDVIGTGCHRYYYDDATGRLQFDDLRAEPVDDPDGWLVPTRSPGGWEPLQYLRTDLQLRARTGQRFSFTGSGNGIVDGHVRPGALALHPDGTYRLEIRNRPTARGSYRFLGGDRQLLRLDPRGPRAPRTSPVQLYFGRSDGRQRLVGIETDWFSVMRARLRDRD